MTLPARTFAHSPKTKRIPERPLPAKQAAVYDFIIAKAANGERFPNMREIREHMGWTDDGPAADCLQRLAFRGKLRRVPVEKTRAHPSRRYRWELI